MIKVEKISKGEFEVTVEDEGTGTKHIITLEDNYYERLTQGKITEKELIKRSFEFLLKREPKESILSRFNLKVINRYFPEYEEKIKIK